jgi:hypothetical protein
VKKICLIGFGGVGIHNPDHKDENPLIRSGHVGFQFEDDPVIYGFHPTEQAIGDEGGLEMAFDHLKKGGELEGQIFDDTAVFKLAKELANGKLANERRKTTVYTRCYEFDDAKHDERHGLVQLWHSQKTKFAYTFPQGKRADTDNCATFPRRIGISEEALPEQTGKLEHYIPEMKPPKGELW